jgi:hypothetical protein
MRAICWAERRFGGGGVEREDLEVRLCFAERAFGLELVAVGGDEQRAVVMASTAASRRRSRRCDQPVDEIYLLLARGDQQAGNDLEGAHAALSAVAAAALGCDDRRPNLLFSVIVGRGNAHVA